MADYDGQIATIPLSTGGLHTDDPQNRVPATDLIDTNNVQFLNGFIEKSPGSLPYNQSALPSGVVGIFDYWPDTLTQRIVAVCRNGKVYRYTNGYLPYAEITAAADASPAALTVDAQTVMVAGGYEVTNNPRKLFIFTQSALQVIQGDSLTRRLMTKPALDWSNSNQPSFGIVHRNSLWAFGNRNNPHTIYRSNALDHEDFQSASANFYTIDSGRSEKLMDAIVYKGALYVIKYPAGLYQLIEDDPSPANWYFSLIQTEFGSASPHSSAAVINDAFIANQNGMISSATAVLAFGNLKAGEVLYELRNENYVRENMSQAGLRGRQATYYSEKHLFTATYQSAGGVLNDRILYIDLNNPQLYKVYWGDKDQANCLALKKDSLGIQRPFYGSDDGFIYEMDREDRFVGTKSYEMLFQTPHSDMGFIAQSYQTVGTSNQYIGDMTKMFEFLELDFEPTGDFDLNVEVIIDGRSAKTMTFNLNGNRSTLDSFVLDQDKTDPQSTRQKRLPLQVSGRRISLRCTNSIGGQNCKLIAFNVYFRVAGHQSESNK